MPYWHRRRYFGGGIPNWRALFWALLMDRSEDGQPFSWFSTDALRTLETHLLWSPMRTGHHAIDARYVGGLSLRRAVGLRRWLRRQREAEAEAFKKAVEDARNTARAR